MPDPPPDGSEVYGDFVQAELERQTARKASFEQRALSVITTSGVLVTLLFGLSALSTKQQATFTLPGTAKVLLLVALTFFVLALGAALSVNVPMVYTNVTAGGLRSAVRQHWNDTPSAARRRLANTRITVLEAAGRVNRVKAWVVFGAIACEFCALLLLAAAIAVVIGES
jgi:hypothetical protein